MPKKKLKRFAQNAAFSHVIQPAMEEDRQRAHELRGNWSQQFFHNKNPIVLEVGCGWAEYSIGLARLTRDKNFIGIDIKGSRLWKGAQKAQDEDLSHVAFVRTKVEYLDHFFGPGEIAEIWVPFPDPQKKSPRRRMVSEPFLARYQMFLQDHGLIHLKTDSKLIFDETNTYLREKQIPILHAFANIDSEDAKALGNLAIQTNYEKKFRADGIPIKYLCFSLPQSISLPAPR